MGLFDKFKKKKPEPVKPVVEPIQKKEPEIQKPVDPYDHPNLPTPGRLSKDGDRETIRFYFYDNVKLEGDCAYKFSKRGDPVDLDIREDGVHAMFHDIDLGKIKNATHEQMVRDFVARKEPVVAQVGLYFSDDIEIVLAFYKYKDQVKLAEEKQVVSYSTKKEEYLESLYSVSVGDEVELFDAFDDEHVEIYSAGEEIGRLGGNKGEDILEKMEDSFLYSAKVIEKTEKDNGSVSVKLEITFTVRG